jgi:hypothetical protein
MQNTYDKTRYASKGNSITHAGYETGIHALPGAVKDKLDQYLRLKYSPAKVLAQLSKEYPGVTLPSRSALYNYRKRYFEQSVVSATSVAKIEEVFDADKINLKSLVVNHVKRFVAVDLPELREHWYRAMEKDEGMTQLSRETREAARLYLEAVKVSMDVMPKLNITVELIEDKAPQVSDEMTPERKKDVYEKMANIINKRVEGLVRMGRPITAETLERGY